MGTTLATPADTKPRRNRRTRRTVELLGIAVDLATMGADLAAAAERLGLTRDGVRKLLRRNDCLDVLDILCVNTGSHCHGEMTAERVRKARTGLSAERLREIAAALGEIDVLPDPDDLAAPGRPVRIRGIVRWVA